MRFVLSSHFKFLNLSFLLATDLADLPPLHVTVRVPAFKLQISFIFLNLMGGWKKESAFRGCAHFVKIIVFGIFFQLLLKLTQNV